MRFLLLDFHSKERHKSSDQFGKRELQIQTGMISVVHSPTLNKFRQGDFAVSICYNPLKNSVDWKTCEKNGKEEIDSLYFRRKNVFPFGELEISPKQNCGIIKQMTQEKR